MEKVLPISNFERMPCNQRAWMQAFIAPLYSASTEDNAMTSCFLLDQQMGPPTNINTYPKCTSNLWNPLPNLNLYIQSTLAQNLQHSECHRILCPECTEGSSWLPSNGAHEAAACILIQNSWHNRYQDDNVSSKASYQSAGGR